MGLSEEEFNKIFDELDELKPQIKLVLGVNNKVTYYLADRIYEVLEKYKDN